MGACEQVTFRFGLVPDCLRRSVRFFSQSQSVAMQNQSNHKITSLDNQLKSALLASEQLGGKVIGLIQYDETSF